MPTPLLRPDAGLDPLRPGYADSVRGVLLGGALGDASPRRAAAGVPEGLPAPDAAGGTADPVLRISTGTQLALYTLDALQEVVEWANEGQGADVTACLWLAYLRWLRGRGEPLPAEAPEPPPRRLDRHELLHAVRNPGGAVLAALRTGRMGEVERPVLPEAKGCGTVVRSAPFGLLPHVGRRTLAPLLIDGAALTHGHPEAQTAAAVHGFTVHAALRARLEGVDRPVAAAVAAAREAAAGLTRPVAETLELLDRAVRAAGPGQPAPVGPTGPPGADRTAPAVLAAGLHAALRAEAEDPGAADPQALFRRAVTLGAPSAAVAGAVLGAAHGTAVLPVRWLARLDARGIVEDAAGQWLRTVGASAAA